MTVETTAFNNPEALPPTQKSLRLTFPTGQIESTLFTNPLLFKSAQFFVRHHHPLSVESVGVLNQTAREILGPDFLPCRVLYAGICGSDRHVVNFDVDPAAVTEFPDAEPDHLNLTTILTRKVLSAKGRILTDTTLGHEIVVEYFAYGQRKVAAVYPLLSCMTKFEEKNFCQPCKNYAENGCERVHGGKIDGRALGLGAVVVGKDGKAAGELGGGFGEWVWVHKKQLIDLPAGLDPKLGILADSMASAGNAFKLVGGEILSLQNAGKSTTVLVIGMGAIGFSLMHCLAQNNIKEVHVLVKHPQQEALIRKYVDDFNRQHLASDAIEYRAVALADNWQSGKAIVPGGFNYIFDCVGSQKSIADARSYLAWNGKIIQAGIPSQDDFRPYSLQLKQGSVLYSFWANLDTFKEAVTRYLPSVPFPISEFLDADHPLEDYEKIFYPKQKDVFIKQGFRVKRG